MQIGIVPETGEDDHVIFKDSEKASVSAKSSQTRKPILKRSSFRGSNFL